MNRLLAFILIIFAFPAFSLSTANAQDAADVPFFSKEVPVELTADSLSYNKELDAYVARGNVVMKQEATTLKADEAILDMNTGIATASGNLIAVDEGNNTLQGESLQFNIRDKTAVLMKARLFYRQQNIFITAHVIRKTGEETYTGEKVTYTTCECEEGSDPAWDFHTSRAKIEVGEFLTGKHVFFEIKGVPVLYSPYISIPIKRDRQSGFLQPKIKYSKLRGLVAENSYFWAISRSADATFYLDVETTRGLGKGLEYRYFRTRKSFGEFLAYHFKENDIDRVRSFRSDVNNLSRPLSAGESRWQLKLLHTELLPYGVKLTANLNFVSDDEFFIDFGDGTERSLESIESNIAITKNWDSYSLVAQFRAFNNLLLGDDSSTLHRLPEVSLTGTNQPIGDTPFYLSLNSSFVNFSREEGMKGQRLDIQPRVSLPLRVRYFDFVPSFAPRGTFYLVKENPDGRFFERYLYEVRGELTTTLTRTYETGYARLKSLYHFIRPKLTYIYIPEEDQSGLPSFSDIDEISPMNSIRYSLNSLLIGTIFEEGIDRKHEYMYFDISQSFDIREASREITAPDDKRRPFSNITAEIILRPTYLSALTAKGSFDVYEKSFDTFDTSATINDMRGDSLSVSYRFVNDQSSYLEANLRAHATRQFDLTYLQRYSFVESRSLEASYGIEYTHQCWSSTLTYSERLEEKIIALTFSLGGLGKIAGVESRVDEL